MKRKITRIGNSLGVTLPQEVLNHIGVKQGDEISFKLENNGNVTIKKQINYDELEEIDQDFLDGIKDLFERYDHTLRNLSDR